MGQIREINVWKTRAFICWRLLSLKQKMHKCYSFRDSLQRNPTIINLLECLFLEFPFFLSLTSESLLFWFVLGLFVFFYIYFMPFSVFLHFYNDFFAFPCRMGVHRQWRARSQMPSSMALILSSCLESWQLAATPAVVHLSHPLLFLGRSSN